MARKDTTDKRTSGDNNEVLEIPGEIDWSMLKQPDDPGDRIHEIMSKADLTRSKAVTMIKKGVASGTIIQGMRGTHNVYRPA